MTTRRRISTTERLAIFMGAHGVCHLCARPIDPVREKWEIEHRLPLELGGEETKGSPNLQPAHASCHKTKSSVDAWALAKARRREARHLGAMKPRSRLGHPTLKRKIDGSVVPR
jgi:5-methylcytosine-specific restriction protein A